MGFGHSGERNEVAEVAYTSSVVTVGTSAVEIYTGGSRDADRQLLMIYNDSNKTVYVGPTGVTTSGAAKGIPILKRDTLILAIGDVGVYMIAASAGNDVIVQELK